MDRAGGHAVVLGGSMAGLLAARVLSEHYSAVTMLDRDELTEDGEPRRGVPQGRQIHALAPRGQQVIEELFPGFTTEIGAAGARIKDTFADGRWYFNGELLRAAPSELVTVSASRPFLEAQVRARVRALSRVRVLDCCDALGYRMMSGQNRVTGVRVLRHDVERTIHADLVVDAMGRGSRTPVWLAELGYPKVAQERFKVGVGYTTREYRLPAGADIGGAVIVIPSPSAPRGAILAAAERDRLIVSGNGVAGDNPPSDPEQFEQYLKALPAPETHEVLAEAVPLGEPVSYRFPVSQRRRYERMRDFPDGLFPIGDSVCSFNPIYAQGMTVAALGALTLRDHLRSGEPRPRTFLRNLAREAIDESWDAMVLNDLGFPGVPGRRGLRDRLLSGYTRWVQRAAARDVAVSRALIDVLSLTAPGASLARPGVALRVLRNL